jgi:hypothetical protein
MGMGWFLCELYSGVTRPTSLLPRQSVISAMDPPSLLSWHIPFRPSGRSDKGTVKFWKRVRFLSLLSSFSLPREQEIGIQI